MIWIMESSVSLRKFADDTKLGRVANTSGGHAAIQRDLDRLKICAVRNLMKFNKEKCKVMHLVRNNAKHQHMLGTTHLASSFARKGSLSPCEDHDKHEATMCPGHKES
ncbi:rna-directed dna polymerase from mobile element jockey-like [Limosa lapponica baueri]|uniref:Rna-directed dna polymerase from mobile element jockey-like n=1 Tax=Limosa lapponica baueri TaxID=1758121 RepID=A0A2I0U2R9_LIMLA|nr:rna-directed dna polymerase from mobile element jockey-like [Limosa lapponica baueri]